MLVEDVMLDTGAMLMWIGDDGWRKEEVVRRMGIK